MESFFADKAGFKLKKIEWQQEQLQNGLQFSSCPLSVCFDCSVFSFTQLSSHIQGTQESVSRYNENKSVTSFIVQK
jgi:hypothetical protein